MNKWPRFALNALGLALSLTGSAYAQLAAVDPGPYTFATGKFPMWYQDNNLTIKDGLDQLALSYGIKITTPTLRGVFTLKTEQNNELSTRLVYTTKMKSGEFKAPEMIEEIRWLGADQAMKLITFPHINAQIAQLTKFPGTIWGGSQLMYLEDGVNKAKFIEPFYPFTDAVR